MVSLSLTDGLYVTFQLAGYVSFFLVSPIICYHLWCFLMPALRPKERFLVRVFLCLGSGLFVVGALLGWLIFLPMLFAYAQFFVPQDVVWMIDLRQYILLFWCIGLYGGLVFEVPLLILALTYFGVLNQAVVVTCRPYLLLGCFIVGMLVTPPDMFAQIGFALPLYGLFEIGWACRFLLWSQHHKATHDVMVHE